MDLPVNKILCGDCLEVMKDWPDKCVDLVLTDPPYGKVCFRGQNQIGRLKDLNRTYESMAWWGKSQKPTTMQLGKILKLGVNYIVWGGNYFLEALPSTNCFLVWDKQGEWAETCFAGVELAITSFTAVARKLTCRRQGWMHDSKDEKIDHPTPKPTELMLWCLEKYSKPSDLILDPFCGSGTTCVAAKMLGRRYIGIDISPEYCKIAEERLKAVETAVPVKEARQGQLSLLENVK